MTMARKNLIATALLAALVLASAMPSRAGRSLLDEAVDNAMADVMPAANATADVMPAAANATEADGASNFNQGSPDCIKPDVTTGLIDAAAGTPDLSTLGGRHQGRWLGECLR